MNVICILYDSLRQDCVQRCPSFVELKSRSLYVSDIMAASTWTKTSIASIFAAAYPVEHGVYYENSVFPDQETWLHKLKYSLSTKTTGISSNPWIMEKFGFSKLFDNFKYVNWDPHSPTIGSEKCCDTKIYSMLKKMFSEHTSNNFVYTHMMRTHQPYHANSYWAGVQACGQQVLDFIDFIDNGPNADNTVVMVVSDHGESLGENGFNFHSDSVQHVEAKVPMFLYSKGSAQSMGTVMDEFVGSNVDIGPTILDIFGLGEDVLESFLPGISVFDNPDPNRIRIIESHARGKTGMGRKTAIVQGNKKTVFHGDKLEYVCDPHTEARIKSIGSTSAIATEIFMGYKDHEVDVFNSLPQEDVDQIKVENSMKELGYL